MSEEIVIKVEEETQAAVEETVSTTIEAAVEIAEKIDEARQEGHHAEELISRAEITLEIVMGEVKSVNAAIGTLMDLVMGLHDQVAALTTIEVAEIIEDHTPAEVEDIVDTAEEIAPPVESPVVAVEPEIRKSTKRNWI